MNDLSLVKQRSTYLYTVFAFDQSSLCVSFKRNILQDFEVINLRLWIIPYCGSLIKYSC